MAKEKAWYADSAVGTLLADMFEGKWSPELLAQLAQIPLAEAERGAFPGCPPSSGRERRFRLVERVQAHKEACSFLLARPSGSGLESFLRLAADGEGLRALETMLGLGLSRMNTLRPAGINLVLRLVHRSLLGIGLRGLSADGAKRYRRLCRDVHPLIVCSGSNTPSLARLFFRARGLAVKFGDRRDMALFDLLIGSINVCNTPEHGNPRFHAIMARGYAALEALKEPDLFEQATPYLGIYHFIEGNYEQAMNLFSRASRKLRAQEHHLVEMFYVRHWSFAASCRGNFELAAGLLLWEKARERKTGDSVPKGVYAANTAVIAGLPLSVAAYFWMNRLLDADLPQRATWESLTFFFAWACCLTHAWARDKPAGRGEQLAAAGLALALLPFLNGLTGGEALPDTLFHGPAQHAGFAIFALLAAMGLFGAGFRSLRRSRTASPLHALRGRIAEMLDRTAARVRGAMPKRGSAAAALAAVRAKAMHAAVPARTEKEDDTAGEHPADSIAVSSADSSSATGAKSASSSPDGKKSPAKTGTGPALPKNKGELSC